MAEEARRLTRQTLLSLWDESLAREGSLEVMRVDPSADIDGDTGVLAPEKTRTKPRPVAKHPGRCAPAA
jgi:hypothetical protein